MFGNTFATDDRAESKGIRSLPALVIMIVIALLFLGLLAPIGFDAFFAADTDNWSDDTIQVWEVLPILVVVVILAVIAAVALRSLPNR